MLASSIKQLAKDLCGGRCVFSLGGGYNLKSLSNSVSETFCAFIDEPNIATELYDDLGCLYDEPSTKDFTAKLADFGVAKCSPKRVESHVTTQVFGMYGYADPKYIATGHLYVKSDNYSFGVLLIETITCQPVMHSNLPTERHNLVDWVRPILGREKKLRTIMDPQLEQTYPLEGAFKCAALALRCLENQPKDRPSRDEVLQSLQEIYAAEK